MIEVFRSRKLEEANRAASLLAGAGIPHERARIVGDIRVAMPHVPEDQLGVAWTIAVPPESREQARQVLAVLIQETGARPPRLWVGPFYLLVMIALVIALSVRACS